MINQSLVASYEQLNTQYYYNFEYYYFQAIKQLLPGALDLRDMLILATIERMEKTKSNTSTLIANGVKMSASAFSNYLRTLENELLVERERGLENRKNMYISLTPRGNELNKLSKRFMQGFVKRLVARLGVINSLNYLNMVIKITHEDISTAPSTISIFSPHKALSIITDALRKINFILYSTEQESLANQTPSMTIREMRLLHGVLYLSNEGEVTPSRLGDYLGFAMSTMTSMLKVLESKRLIHRTTVKSDLRKLLITLDDSAEPLLEYFMKLRLDIFNTLTPRLTSDELLLLIKSFQILKEYSLESINL